MDRPPRHDAHCSFRFPDGADARAVLDSLDVESGDRIPNVDAVVTADDTEPTVLHVALSSPGLSDLRAATKSFLTRIRAAAAALEEASARQQKKG